MQTIIVLLNPGMLENADLLKWSNDYGIEYKFTRLF